VAPARFMEMTSATLQSLQRRRPRATRAVGLASDRQ
jgi:hypothetical protein